MGKLKTALAKAQTKAMLALAGVKEEKGDHLLEVLGTIIIALVILVLFRGYIVNIFTNAMSNTDSTVSNLFTPAGFGGTT